MVVYSWSLHIASVRDEITYLMYLKSCLLIVAMLLCASSAMPQKLRLSEPVTNQSSALLPKGESHYLYTFFGLDSTKKWSGVHNKVLHNAHSGLVPP